MKKNQIFILKDRGVVHISGKDSKEFLQNIITNDINKVSKTNSCFSSLLTPQGKYLFDFIIIEYKDGYLFDSELSQIDDLINKLNIYKLNSNVKILNLSDKFEVAAISVEKFLELDGTKNEEGNTIFFRNDPFFVDPRNRKLGSRAIINLERLYMSVKKLNLKIVDQKEYYQLSHKLGIAQVNTKNLQNRIFGIECNFEKLNCIDFKKGCYIGQENTARMKMKNKIRKTLLPISFEGNLPALSEITFKERVVGKILIPEPYPFALFNIVDPDIKDFIKSDLLSNNTKLKIINV